MRGQPFLDIKTGERLMTFPTVKSSPYGTKKYAPRRHLWSDSYWRRLCFEAFIKIKDQDKKKALSKFYRFTASQLATGDYDAKNKSTPNAYA